jgi:uncharacterized protein YycO
MALVLMGTALALGCAGQRLQGVHGELTQSDYARCWRVVQTQKTNPALHLKTLQKETRSYQLLVEELLQTRAKTASLLKRVQQEVDPDQPIPPILLDKMKRTLKKGLSLNRRFEHFFASHECYLEAGPKTMASKGLKPLDGQVRLMGAAMALSSSLMLYDTYLTTGSAYYQDDRLRRFLNQSDLGYGIKQDQLQAINETFASMSNALLMSEGIEFYKQGLRQAPPALRRQKEFAYLAQLIRESPSFRLLMDPPAGTVLDRSLSNRDRAIRDNLNALNRAVTAGISGAFGNLVGSFEERKGKLYNDPTLRREIRKYLRAGDILLEKTPFRLTDRLIPGHWGHAAIWVGGEQELRSLGIWGHPVVRRYHAAIKKGELVVEALRDGVQLNTLEHFMNIDDLAVLRQPSLSKHRLAEYVILALRQVGKEYDFNFDVETTDRIVCSELVYVVYVDLDWPTEKMLGRYTISPDNVAVKALNGGPLDVVLLYHDGKKVEHNPKKVMGELAAPASATPPENETKD